MRKKKAVSDEIVIASFNERNRTVSNERLSQIFERAGMRYGYDRVEACFKPFPDFKVRWTRSFKWIEFEVSDYLDRAPDEVLSDLAETVFVKISGRECDYSEAFIRYLEDSAPDNRSDFISRKRLTETSIGQYHDLNDCVDRLRSQGLIPSDMECILCWDGHTGRKASGCSTIQRIVWVNTALDRKGVPETVLDFAVYTMMAHLMVGFGSRMNGSDHDRLEALYPMRDEAIAWLEDNGFVI